MTSDGLQILYLPSNRRTLIEYILEESFTGLYLWHSKKILKEAENIWVATLDGNPIGVLIPKVLRDGLGYIYYVAVGERYRRRGVGGKLLDHALEDFFRKGAKIIFASVQEDNTESLALFVSHGFSRADFSSISEKFGRLEAAKLYSKMMVVPGERLLCKEMSPKPDFR